MADLTNLGAGGLLAYLIIKEFVNFSKQRKELRVENGRSGDVTEAKWKLNISDIVEKHNAPIVTAVTETNRKLDAVAGQAALLLGKIETLIDRGHRD